MEQVGLVEVPQCLADFKVMEVLVELEVQRQVILRQVKLVQIIEVVEEVLMVILALHLQQQQEMVVVELL